MKILAKTLSILVTICIPFFLLMGSISILLNPFFLDYEYNLPAFPADDFGFSTADRLKWGKLSLDYLTNNESDAYLGTLKFEDGSPLYNERELSHMLDVRLLVKAALGAWYLVTAFLILIGLFSWKLGRTNEYGKAISRGGWLTLGLILAILAAVLIDFNSLFAGFHAIFFKGDTWLFFTNDTLIRLFPEKLWSDAFIYMGVFTLVGAVIFAFVLGRLSQKD
jgi:integral membrane protein (TIGR01906 family)